MLQFVVATVLGLAQGGPDSRPDIRFLQPATYLAGSPPDPTALGGYGTSDNYPLAFQSPGPLHPGLYAELKKTSSGVELTLANGGADQRLLSAADSNLWGFLQGKDEKGRWTPLEYHWWVTCGNSYHRVLLPKNHFWTYRVRLPRGSFRTEVRWVLGPSSKPTLTSNEIEFSIAKSRFHLSPAMSETYAPPEKEGAVIMMKG